MRIFSILNVLHPVIKVPIRSYRFCSTFYQHHLLRDCMIFLQFKHFKPVRLKFSYTNGSIKFLFPLVHLFTRFTLFRRWPFIICQKFLHSCIKMLPEGQTLITFKKKLKLKTKKNETPLK
jgi:hypothetical protein